MPAKLIFLPSWGLPTPGRERNDWAGRHLAREGGNSCLTIGLSKNTPNPPAQKEKRTCIALAKVPKDTKCHCTKDDWRHSNSKVSCIYQNTAWKPLVTTVQMKTFVFLNWCYVLPQCLLFLESQQFIGVPSIDFFSLRSKWKTSYYYLRMDSAYGLGIFVCLFCFVMTYVYVCTSPNNLKLF